MSASAPTIHVHRPKVLASVGDCRICDRPLEGKPVLVQSGKQSEWVHEECWVAIEEALAQVGERRVRAFMAGGTRA